ncbi:MAG TPA: S-adenosylmethionine:tRNA ribosyltransferase-isomerase [Acidimicrobiales bacterium]|nr:S-adenosylmethionine:tRNA ribosyltransferase-isomerase [Acidimicrobiales bacterium]
MRLFDTTEGSRRGAGVARSRAAAVPPAAAGSTRPTRPVTAGVGASVAAAPGPVAAPAAAPAARAVRSSLPGFGIPRGGEAGTPVELARSGGALGSDARAEVRLMVGHRSTGSVAHHRFAALGDALAPGDVLVVNTSAVVPAALDATGDGGDRGTAVRLHLSTEQPGGFWVVEPRRPAGPGTERYTGAPPRRLSLPGGGRAELLAPYPAGTDQPRLWLARLDVPGALPAYLAEHGGPIRYAHAQAAWPLAAYQSVFSRDPGSVEMPSAARPFTTALVTELVSRGVAVAPVTLHTGVSSQEAGEPPYAERFRVPAATAALVNAAHDDGRRVVAVGTTVVRALETTADERGRSHPGEGWTELVVSPERGVRIVDGLLTGWHEPESSHLAMLEAVAGPALLEASYAAAVAGGYRWHEFGDSHLILP